MSVEVWAINSKIARRYALIMIHKCFYKREARAESYDHSHCYESYDPKTEQQNYYLISHTRCGYCSSNELASDAVRYWGNPVKTGKVWYI